MRAWTCCGHADWRGEHQPVTLGPDDTCLICNHDYTGWVEKMAALPVISFGTDLAVTHPCPRCNGVDKLTCPRCDGSGRVGSRTRAEQVEAYLREESTYRHVLGGPGAVGFPMDAAESLRSRLR